MPSRNLDYPVFDADNHFYEPKEALTQFLPDHRKGVIDYIDVRGRTKIMVRNVVSDYIPNPTFEVVARPGAQEDYFRNGSGGKSYREVMGKPMKAIPAFRNPEARLEVLDGLGLDYTLMFPTLASLVEERLMDDPDLILDIVHGLNQWMYETWQFNYEDRIFSTAVINLGNVDRALAELEWCLERGAKTVLVRPAPVPGYRGSRSLGLPEFDPFWDACVKAGIPVSMHASDSGYSNYLNDWEPGSEFKPFSPTSFRMVAMGKRPIEDTMAALVCHGALTRNPDLRILSVENGGSWVPYLFYQFKDVYAKMPDLFPEEPIEAFKRVCTSRRSGRTTSRRWPTSSPGRCTNPASRSRHCNRQRQRRAPAPATASAESKTGSRPRLRAPRFWWLRTARARPGSSWWRPIPRE
jgi:predicted TIM-barrel fold metal-dependent hydrolase